MPTPDLTSEIAWKKPDHACDCLCLLHFILYLFYGGKCFLEAGIICMGPATRSGCGERCINANMPCRGCYGPPDGVKDQGLSMMSALASIIKPDEEKDIQSVLESLPDSIIPFYMYGLPSSIMFRKKMEKE